MTRSTWKQMILGTMAIGLITVGLRKPMPVGTAVPGCSATELAHLLAVVILVVLGPSAGCSAAPVAGAQAAAGACAAVSRAACPAAIHAACLVSTAVRQPLRC